MVFNTGPYTVLPDNSILITANMLSEKGFPSSHQLKSYVASKSRLKLVARAVLSADAGLLVCFKIQTLYIIMTCLTCISLLYTGQSGYVFSHQAGDFMKPVVDIG